MNHHKHHRINTEEYQRELQELFAQKPMLMKSLRALTAEHEELQKQLNSAKNMTKSDAGDSDEQPTNEQRGNKEVGFGPRPSNTVEGGRSNERVSAAQRPRSSKDVMGKSETLAREFQKLLKAFQKNNTWYPENSDPDGLPHPSGDKTEKHTAINGKAVWRHNQDVRIKNDKSLDDAIQYGDFPASIQTPKGKQLFIQLAKMVAADPDRHVIGSGTSINKPPTFKELRTRHLLGTIKNYSQYTATETSKGIEIVAPRHSKSTMSQATHTKWIFDGKELKSEDIMSKSTGGGVYGLKKSVTRGTGSALPAGGGLRNGNERAAQSASLEKSVSEIAGSDRNKMGRSIFDKTQKQLKKAEDEAGMTAYPLKDGYSLHHETTSNGYDIWSIGHGGQRAGSFMICTDETRRGRPFVSWAGVDKPHRGKGVGAAVYKTLAVHYGGLDSDRGSTSVDALKAWHRAGGKQLKSKTQFGDYRYTLKGDKKRPPIVWNEDLIKSFKSQWGGTLPDTDNSHVERNEWWHGTPSGRFPLNNIHVGSKRAAHEALTATIGHPVEGEWDGTREYGKTLLAGKKTLEAREIPITGYSVDAPFEDHYPTGKAKYSDGTQVSSSEKPNMLRFKIKGKMTSHPHTPRTDMAANAIMKRKGIKQGIYYVNEGEDPGSISAVVPSVEHLEQVINKKKNEDLEKAQELNKKPLKPLKGLHAEAAKYNNFNDFKKAFLNEIKHGTYWHVTDNPNFQIDPKTGPRDMTSLGMGKKDIGQLMVTSHLEHWVNFYGKKNRPYAALIDMSDVHPNDYKQVNRQFGNEFNVKNPQKAKTIKVMPVDEAIKYSQKQHKKMPQNEEELRNLYENVHKQNSSKSQNLEKTRGTLTFPKVLPKDTRPEETIDWDESREIYHAIGGKTHE